MGINPRMQQVEQQRKQGDGPTAEQVIGQPIAKIAAEDKEQVGQRQPQPVDMVIIGQSQGLLGQE